MHPTGILAVLAALVSCSAVAAFAQPSGVPTTDVQKTCRAASGAMVQLMGGSSPEHDLEICLSAEQRAREQLVKDWTTYSSGDRAQCVRTTVYLPSYVEWLTCLEMERDVRKMKIDQPNPSAATKLPFVRPGTLW